MYGVVLLAALTTGTAVPAGWGDPYRDGYYDGCGCYWGCLYEWGCHRVGYQWGYRNNFNPPGCSCPCPYVPVSPYQQRDPGPWAGAGVLPGIQVTPVPAGEPIDKLPRPVKDKDKDKEADKNKDNDKNKDKDKDKE